jgi:protein SCO1/2
MQSRLKTVRLILWIAVLAVAIGAGALALRQQSSTGATQATLQPTLGGPFTLVGTDGQAFPSRRLEGRPYAIFFGFTHCPDVCPTTLARLAKLRRDAGGERAFDIVFVSIDPERDTPEEMRTYAAQFETPIIALTGSPAQVDSVKRSYGVYAEKAPLPGAGHAAHQGYSMNHTSAVLLFNASGQLTGMIAARDSDEAALTKLRAISA